MSATFEFKQFTIRQNRCAMKVGTDGILLGAWCDLCHNDAALSRVLDIGTGTGLVALMLAQRNPAATVEGIEIDKAAFEQANENFQVSPWSNRLRAILGCVKSFAPASRYTLIAANPPWFNESLKSATPARNLARHDDSLTRSELLSVVNRLLEFDGRFCIILPATDGREFRPLAESYGLHCQRICEVRAKSHKAPGRLLLEFGRTGPSIVPQTESLTVEGVARHDYTAEFRELTREFYLRF
jgi:tRNA1Val (adenine37-N6)-methyltransferase